jgi:hypothetical protein
MNDGCRYDRHNQSTLCATLSLPLAAAGRCPGSTFTRAMTSKSVNPPNAPPRRPACRL